MKKVIIGAAAVGAVVGLGIVGRRIGHKMRDHCGQMAAQCKQMMAGQFGERRERCGQMAGQFRGPGEEAETREETDQGAPRFVGQGEGVGVA
jgi:hypothetical protein